MTFLKVFHSTHRQLFVALSEMVSNEPDAFQSIHDLRRKPGSRSRRSIIHAGLPRLSRFVPMPQILVRAQVPLRRRLLGFDPVGCSVVDVGGHRIATLLQFWSLHQQRSRQNLGEDALDPRGHLVRRGRFEVDMQRVHSQENGRGHYNHDKKQVFPDEGDDERGGRVHVGQQQEEHGEGQQDGDGQGDLLPAVRGKVEHKDGEAGDGDAGHDEVQGVEEGAASQLDVERDVRVRLWAARVKLHLRTVR